MQSFPFLDAHTHVQFSAYDADRDEVIGRAFKSGVRFVNVGTQRDTSRNAVLLAKKYDDGVYAAVGLHPTHTGRSRHDADELGGGEAAKAFVSRGETFDHDYYYALAMDPKTVAIGECGLDFFHFDEFESRDLQIAKQKNAFITQIELAHEVAISQFPFLGRIGIRKTIFSTAEFFISVTTFTLFDCRITRTPR